MPIRGISRNSGPVFAIVAALLAGGWAAVPSAARAAQDDAAALAGTIGSAQALLDRAETDKRLGRVRRAIEALEAALAAPAGRLGDLETAALQASLGGAYLLAGRHLRAESALQASLKFAEASGDGPLAARILGDLGNVAAAQGRTDAAVSLFEASHARAADAGADGAAVTAAVNAARTLIDAGRLAEGEAWADRASAALARVGGARNKAEAGLAVGRLLERLSDRQTAVSAARRQRIRDAFETARRLAVEIGDDRTASYAYGYLGETFERAGQTDDAVRLTRTALFKAMAANAPEIAYRWQWQLGRLHRAQGRADAALSAYRDAVAMLRTVRSDYLLAAPGGRASFKETVSPVLMELVDLLLKSADRAGEPGIVQARLDEARTTLELFKTVELEDYFGDECVSALQATAKPIDRLAEGTAALYPILLPDRTELLVSHRGGIFRATVPVGSAEMSEEVERFARLLQDPVSREYRAPAEKLYDWLIRPIEPMLQEAGIETLVFIPDGKLRTVPLAPLYDGERHLVEKYALAVAPGLTLLDPRPLGKTRIDPLISGLTKSVRGFSVLPNVDQELESISALYGGKLLKDEAFVASSLQRELDTTPYSVIHLASHAQFGHDPADSFIVTYDGKLDMDGLEKFVKLSRFRDEPVELLTMSACSTAIGDERASLGLSGLAIKAGARSAVGSLWFIQDESTSRLMAGFYRRLGQASTSKAEALREAQLALLHDRRYAHPYFWSAFILIGNWL